MECHGQIHKLQVPLAFETRKGAAPFSVGLLTHAFEEIPRKHLTFPESSSGLLSRLKCFWRTQRRYRSGFSPGFSCSVQMVYKDPG